MSFRTKVRAVLGKLLPPPRDKAVIDAARALKMLLTGKPGAKAPVERKIEAAFASGDPDQIARSLKDMHALQARVERLATPPRSPAGVRISETSGAQSLQFMVDLLPHIQKLIGTYPRKTKFTVLDVGPGLGTGTELLAQMYSRVRLGYRMKVTAIDITTAFRDYLLAIAPRVTFVHGDVFEREEKYDIIIASHVIEHVPDPIGFSKRLQELANIAVFVAAPYDEPADKLIPGHIQVIDDAVIDALKPTSYELVHSASWGAEHDPPYKMVIAQLPGLAGGGPLTSESAQSAVSS